MQFRRVFAPARCLMAAVLLAMVAWAGEASATDRGEKDARVHFQKAENAFNLGKFDESLGEYQAAYESKPLPGFLFNIAQCYRHLGNPERARFFYQRYLALEPETPNRKVVEDLVAEMDRSLEEQKGREGGTARPLPSAVSKPRPATLVVNAPPDEKPLLKTWWFWTGVGALAAGAVVAAFLLTRSPEDPRGSLGAIDARP